MCWRVALLLAGSFGAYAKLATSQENVRSLPAARPGATAGPSGARIQKIEVVGLKRIPVQTVRVQIGSQEGAPLDERRVEKDVRTLAGLGWFSDIRVESGAMEAGTGGEEGSWIRLRYVLEESPFLTGVTFAGSRLLTREQIEKLLKDKNAMPRTGEPVNDALLVAAGVELRGALRELGHPEAQVQVKQLRYADETVRVRYEIEDGPKVTIGKIGFDGNTGVGRKELLGQMKALRPGTWFAGVRGKNAFTEEAFESDRARLLNYYADHGYPEARIGNANVKSYQRELRKWWPWPHRIHEAKQKVRIPVEAGTFYRFEGVEVSLKLKEAAEALGQKSHEPHGLQGEPFSAQAVEQLRRTWFAKVNRKPGDVSVVAFRGVDAERTFDPAAGAARVRLTLSEERPILVDRIEICGLHKFTDRFVRRRLVLQEDMPLDERALEAGLARLARTGYFQPMKNEDVRVEVKEENRTAQVTLTFREIGQQRISLTGGQSTFGSTLGVVYAVFDLLNREELLSTQIEGGPQSALLVLGLAKDGFLASRGSLALSLFDSVLRPRLVSSAKGPFYTSQSVGANVGWNYQTSATDAVGVNYSITRNVTHYSLDVPEALTGAIPGEIRARTDSRAIGVGWTRDKGRERKVLGVSFSGGWLGGNENVLRSSAEYSRIAHDPIFEERNAWAFRLYASGAGSYAGDMPVYARLFAGDELVRGLRRGELGPYALSSTIDGAGATKYAAVPAGTNLVTAANAEYRVPLRDGMQAAGFLDLGSGVMLPNWLGTTRPALFSATNGILHASTGFEFSWTVPGVRIPVRTYWAVNVLRWNRVLPLPDGTTAHPSNKLSAFGWALGSLF